MVHRLKAPQMQVLGSLESWIKEHPWRSSNLEAHEFSYTLESPECFDSISCLRPTPEISIGILLGWDSGLLFLKPIDWSSCVARMENHWSKLGDLSLGEALQSLGELWELFLSESYSQIFWFNWSRRCQASGILKAPLRELFFSLMGNQVRTWATLLESNPTLSGRGSSQKEVAQGHRATEEPGLKLKPQPLGLDSLWFTQSWWMEVL